MRKPSERVFNSFYVVAVVAAVVVVAVVVAVAAAAAAAAACCVSLLSFRGVCSLARHSLVGLPRVPEGHRAEGSTMRPYMSLKQKDRKASFGLSGGGGTFISFLSWCGPVLTHLLACRGPQHPRNRYRKSIRLPGASSALGPYSITALIYVNLDLETSYPGRVLCLNIVYRSPENWETLQASVQFPTKHSLAKSRNRDLSCFKNSDPNCSLFLSSWAQGRGFQTKTDRVRLINMLLS